MEETRLVGLSQNQLKAIAAAAMVVDHLGVQIFPQYIAFRIIGRLAFPIFAYFIYEGMKYTHRPAAYLGRMLAMGTLCVVGYGVFGLMMCQYAYMTSISYSNAGTTTVLQTLSLVIIMLLTCLRLRRRPNRVETVALVLALLGTFLLATGGDPAHMVLSPQGLFWGLATAVAVTVYTLLPRRLLARWNREAINGWGMLIGGAILNLGARSWTLHTDLPLQGWLAVAAIVLFGTVLSFTLFMQGIQDVGPVKSSMLAATEPVSATVFSAVWLGTAFSAVDLMGFAAIIATIFLLARSE